MKKPAWRTVTSASQTCLESARVRSCLHVWREFSALGDANTGIHTLLIAYTSGIPHTESIRKIISSMSCWKRGGVTMAD